MVKIIFVKDTERGYKKGEVTNCSQTQAEEIIKEGYAKYIEEGNEEISKKIKEEEKEMEYTDKKVFETLVARYGDIDSCFYDEEKYKNKDNPGWSTWQIRDSLEPKTLRGVYPEEIVLDKENKSFETEKTNLDKLELKYKIFDSGGKGIHIHFFISELKNYDSSIRPYIKRFIFEQIAGKKAVDDKKLDPKKSDNRTIIGLEFSKHRTGNQKTLLFQNDTRWYPDNKLWSEVLEYIKTLPEKFEGSIISDIKPTIVFQDKKPCEAIQKLIDNGVKKNHRNYGAMLITNQLRDYCGKDEKEIWEVIKKYNEKCEEPKTESRIRRDFAEQYKRKYGINCNTLKEKGYCIVNCETCPYYKDFKEEADYYDIGEIEIENKVSIENKEVEEKEDIKKEEVGEIKSQPETKKEIKLSPHEVNFITNSNYSNWSSIRKLSKTISKSKDKLFFFSHTKNTIKGKPILFFSNIMNLKVMDKVEYKNDNDETCYDYKFLDERYDGREFKPIQHLYLNFWVYRMIFESREYIVLSKSELGEQDCLLKGMMIELKDAAELSKTLKLSTITPCFFVFSSEPSIKTLSKEDLVEYCKKLEWTENIFTDITFLHPTGKIYKHTPDFNTLINASLLSGKYDEYPLHLLMMGPAGAGKTTLEECLNFKFQEAQSIYEAGNSTIKGLIPSFRENPASPGYILRCSRFALVDELMKMLDSAKSMYKELYQVQFGQLNMLLEHKRRMIGSGSGNNFIAHATAKMFFATNPLMGKPTIFQHAFDLDNTTLSRMLIWVQDEEHQKLINERRSGHFSEIFGKDFGTQIETVINHAEPSLKQIYIEKWKNNHKNIHNNKYNVNYRFLLLDKIDIYIVLYVFIFPFLTIYDSCQKFLVEFDEEKIRVIFKEVLKKVKDPMKSIFNARGLHHSYLLLDGIVKTRCLFKDHDITYTPKEEDYEKLKNLLLHIVKTWDTDLSVRDEVNIIEEGQITMEDVSQKQRKL